MENKLTKGVFLNIMSGDIDDTTKFLNEQKSLKTSKLTNGLFNEYKTIVNRNYTDFEKLSRLEEIILQDRAINNMGEIKFSDMRNEYIYARTDFYRSDRVTKDIRVIVAKVSDVCDDKSQLEDVYNDTRFINIAKIKLQDAMSKILKENITKFQIDYETN